MLPMFLDVLFVLTVLAILFPYTFLLITFGIILFYVIVTFVITEWRAKYFKAMNVADNAYVQRSTDSLLNFETVKYFNAETHESDRFLKSLQNYRDKNIRVVRSLIVLGTS